MGMELQENRVVFSGVVYEDVISELREHLQLMAPEEIVFDLEGCDDLHLGVLQLILAYVKTYDARFAYPETSKPFQKLCEGFAKAEEFCA